jgi:lysophospholipase L1-like esterase
MKIPTGSQLIRGLLPAAVLCLFTACQTVTIDPVAREAAEKRWANELAEFERADAARPPEPGGMLLVGSSSFRMWNQVAAAFPERRVVNRGFGGSQMHELLALTDRLVWPYAPKEILVYEGDNDLASQKEPAQIEEEFRAFATLVHRRLPAATIYFVAIKPSPSRVQLLEQARETNERIAAYCATRSWLKFIDVFTPMLQTDGQPRPELFIADRLHLNDAGYALWTEVIRRELGLD